MHTYTDTHTHIYIYIYVCVCVCVVFLFSCLKMKIIKKRTKRRDSDIMVAILK